jgi:hypothetical protein
MNKPKPAPTTKIEIIDGEKFVSSVYRGVEYTLMKQLDEWYVHSKRLALGRRNPGGGKVYKTIKDVAEGCKAFGSEENIMSIFYGLELQAQYAETE